VAYRLLNMRLFFWLMLLVTMPAAASAPTPSKAVGKRAHSFVLEDQFEKQWSWSTHWKGKPVVLVLSDWKGSDYITAWTEPLVQRYADRVKFVACADVSLAPGFLKSYLRGRFRETYTTSILLDWEGTVFKHYLTQAGLPNVLYIDADETVRLHTWGTGKHDHVDAFAQHLDRLLTER
jgi:hypothetical protein